VHYTTKNQFCQVFFSKKSKKFLCIAKACSTPAFRQFYTFSAKIMHFRVMLAAQVVQGFFDKKCK